jgi:hypothetical protein
MKEWYNNTMTNNVIRTNLGDCPICEESRWGVKLNSDGIAVSFCIECSGDYAAKLAWEESLNNI